MRDSRAGERINRLGLEKTRIENLFKSENQLAILYERNKGGESRGGGRVEAKFFEERPTKRIKTV